ncbi:uncharacterized protein LOC116196200 [Punica granatum]|nr:uncharacterized protein LOC116196200 [Punica granatum]XP_031381790.1 uncharacterized protein LOC116196200 [Punica granatum]OWM81072.1 hypothetical protein CDL15_Pgr007103 [Punica granatum]
MEFTGERSRTVVSGLLPEYGAIFMSNTHTKKECLRKKLFGLPSSFSDFVKNVKAGMVLFLFEYERRLLYGVFEAASDGEINIIPTAYGSSGKRFPAQVLVKRIWNCDPLSEHEFSIAIKDNYFGPKKFHFGLSQYQVEQLLHLFSSRKISRDLDLFTIREFRSKRSRSSGNSNSGTSIPMDVVSSLQQDTETSCLDKREVSSLKNSPSSQISQSSVNLSMKCHPQHDSTMTKGDNSSSFIDDLGDFIPLSVPSDNEGDVEEGKLLLLDDRTKFARSDIDGDEDLFRPYIPVPIFGGERSETINTDQDSPVGSRKYPFLAIVAESSSDAKQAKSVMGSQELCDAGKGEEIPSIKSLYCDTPHMRKSVFSRLNFAIKEKQEEDNRDRVDKFMDEVMRELQLKPDLQWGTKKEASSAELVGEGTNLRSNVFKRLGGGPSKTKITGQKRLYSTMDAEYMEFLQMHSLDWDEVTPSAC